MLLDGEDLINGATGLTYYYSVITGIKNITTISTLIRMTIRTAFPVIALIIVILLLKGSRHHGQARAWRVSMHSRPTGGGLRHGRESFKRLNSWKLQYMYAYNICIYVYIYIHILIGLGLCEGNTEIMYGSYRDYMGAHVWTL